MVSITLYCFGVVVTSAGAITFFFGGGGALLSEISRKVSNLMLLLGGHYFRNSMVAKYMFLVSATHYLSKRYVRASHPPMRIMGRFFCLAILNIPVERISQLLRTWQQLGMRGELMSVDIEQFFICPWNKNGKQNSDHGWAKARVFIGFANSRQECVQSDWFLEQST